MTIFYSDTEGIPQSLVLFLPFYMLMRAIYTSLFPGLFCRSKALSHPSHGGTPADLHSSTHSLLHLCKQALQEVGIPEQGGVCQRAFLSSDTLVTQELAAGVTCSLPEGSKKALLSLTFDALESKT